MRRLLKPLAVVAIAGTGLSACATKPPVLSGSPSYSVVSADIMPSLASRGGFSAALDAILDAGGGPGRAALVEADVTALRTNSPIIGIFYGGPNHATVSGSIADAVTGRMLDRFVIHVSDEGPVSGAGERLAADAASAIRARAANLPVTGRDGAATASLFPERPTVVAPPRASAPERRAAPVTVRLRDVADEAVVETDAADLASPADLLPPLPAPPPGVIGDAVPAPANASDEPCVIGPDGKCIVL